MLFAVALALCFLAFVIGLLTGGMFFYRRYREPMPVLTDQARTLSADDGET